jgi:hypothetical protein
MARIVALPSASRVIVAGATGGGGPSMTGPASKSDGSPEDCVCAFRLVVEATMRTARSTGTRYRRRIEELA